MAAEPAIRKASIVPRFWIALRKRQFCFLIKICDNGESVVSVRAVPTPGHFRNGKPLNLNAHTPGLAPMRLGLGRYTGRDVAKPSNMAPRKTPLRTDRHGTVIEQVISEFNPALSGGMRGKAQPLSDGVAGESERHPGK
ncbi:MAG: hypothetical protein EAZ42_00770 [Verrucomicrobia bacterium]|nr:MAG: hypothetical protein EAZ42_00770 [Verrucomicrobiota bacterium]